MSGLQNRSLGPDRNHFRVLSPCAAAATRFIMNNRATTCGFIETASFVAEGEVCPKGHLQPKLSLARPTRTDSHDVCRASGSSMTIQSP